MFSEFGKLERTILQLIQQFGWISFAQLKILIPAHERAIYEAIQSLRYKGQITVKGLNNDFFGSIIDSEQSGIDYAAVDAIWVMLQHTKNSENAKEAVRSKSGLCYWYRENTYYIFHLNNEIEKSVPAVVRKMYEDIRSCTLEEEDIHTRIIFTSYSTDLLRKVPEISCPHMKLFIKHKSTMEDIPEICNVEDDV